MSEERDPLLQALFARAEEELPGEAFTEQVMARLEQERSRAFMLWVGAALALVILVFATPLHEAVELITRGLTVALFELPEGWAALLLGPFNNVAVLLAGLLFVARFFYRKLFST